MVNYYPGAFPRSELHFGSHAPFHSITHSIYILNENLLDENIGRSLIDIIHSKILFDPPPRVMGIKTKVN